MASEKFGFDINTDFFRKVGELSGIINVELEHALYRESERLMTMAKELTPVDTGTLRSSGRVEGPEFGLNSITFILAYGGPAIGYALRVHEDLMMHHLVGQAKFLEAPVREEVGTGRSERRVLADMARGV